jgi:hypothetical protein
MNYSELVKELRTDECDCLDAYKDRGLTDPQCQSCASEDERYRSAEAIEALVARVAELEALLKERI